MEFLTTGIRKIYIHSRMSEKKMKYMHRKMLEYRIKKTAVTTPVSQQDKNQFNKFQQRGTSQAEVDELEKKLLAH